MQCGKKLNAMQNVGAGRKIDGCLKNFEMPPDGQTLNVANKTQLLSSARWKEVIGYHGTALVMIDTYLAAYPNDARAYLLRARVKEAGKNYEGAIEDLDRAIELGFDGERGEIELAKAYLLRARAREQLGDKEGCKQDDRMAGSIRERLSP